MPRYLLTVTDDDARLLEGLLGGRLQIIPATGPPGAPGTVSIAGLDAVTDDEAYGIRARLRDEGPLYHAGGPQRRACADGVTCVNHCGSGPCSRGCPRLSAAGLDAERTVPRLPRYPLDTSVC